MTCYFRHLQSIFQKAGLQVTKTSRREVDRLIHEMLGVAYKDCPAAWREVKRRIAEDEEGFISRLKDGLLS